MDAVSWASLLVGVAGVIVGIAAVPRRPGGGRGPHAALALVLISVAIILSAVDGVFPRMFSKDAAAQDPASTPTSLRVGPDPAGVLADPSPGKYGVRAVTFSHDSTWIATTDDSGTAYLWKVASRTMTRTFVAPEMDSQHADITDASFSPDDSVLATSDNWGDTELWRLSASAPIGTLTDPNTGDYGALAVSYSPDGTLLATADSSGTTYLWNTSTMKQVFSVHDPSAGKYGVEHVVFSPDGTLIATVDSNGDTYLWSMSTHKLAATMKGSADDSGWAAFSPDSKIIATALGTDQVTVWDSATHKQISTLSDPGGSDVAVQTVAFSPDDTVVAGGDSNGTAYLWNVSSGGGVLAKVQDPRAGEYGVLAIAVSFDGTSLATADSNGDTYLWSLSH